MLKALIKKHDFAHRIGSATAQTGLKVNQRSIKCFFQYRLKNLDSNTKYKHE